MAFYQFKREQLLPSSVQEMWDFISSPENLKTITPPSMGFDITSGELPDKMYQGMIISYRISPLAGIKTTWVTEITYIDEPHYFVDEQRMGPYAMWHHQHLLEPFADGVRMTDLVSYRPPMGFLGTIANKLIIEKKLNEIFDFREKVLEKRFGKFSPANKPV